MSSFQTRVAAMASQTSGRPYFYGTTERFEEYALKGGLKRKNRDGSSAELTLFANPDLAREYAGKRYKVEPENVVLIEVDPRSVALPNNLGLRGQRGGAHLGGFEPENDIVPRALKASKLERFREYGDTGVAMRR